MKSIVDDFSVMTLKNGPQLKKLDLDLDLVKYLELKLKFFHGKTSQSDSSIINV